MERENSQTKKRKREIGPVSHQFGLPRFHDDDAGNFEGLRSTGQTLWGGDHFAAKTLRDLLLRVEYQALAPGAHTQRLQLYLPDGALYQQFTTALEAGGGGKPAAEAHPAHAPRAPGAQPGTEQVVTRLPVGGTWITQYSLYGTWRVEVYLDQARTPTVQRTFVLAP